MTREPKTTRDEIMVDQRLHGETTDRSNDGDHPASRVSTTRLHPFEDPIIDRLLQTTIRMVTIVVIAGEIMHQIDNLVQQRD